MFYNSILFALWLLLMQGDISAYSIIMGVIIVVIIRYSLSYMGVKLSFPFNHKITLYMMWLLREMMSSAIAVVKVVWNPSLPIRPGFDNIKTNLKTDASRVLYANSITLTPGTYTVDLEDDGLLVHSLVRQSKWPQEMEKRVGECD